MIRVVLDTNVVLSALLFTSGRLALIRRAWQHGRLQPLVCRETVSELLRVLCYPKFRLSAQARQELLEDFLPQAAVVQLPDTWPVLPLCREGKDQMFLVLTHEGLADAPVTGARDLLAMCEVYPGLILSPEELAQRCGITP